MKAIGLPMQQVPIIMAADSFSTIENGIATDSLYV